jgi:hypothetical protein
VTDVEGVRDDSDKGPGGWKGVVLGLVLTIVLHVVGGMLILASINDPGGYKGLGVIMFLGVVQLLYMIPAILLARMGGHRALAKGLIIGAAVTFLLNATCWMVAVQ